MVAILQLDDGEILARRLCTLREAKKAIEKELDDVERQILALYPALAVPGSGPQGPFRTEFRRRLVLDTAKAWPFVLKRPALRGFFSLGLPVANWERLGEPNIGRIETGAPSLKIV